MKRALTAPSELNAQSTNFISPSSSPMSTVVRVKVRKSGDFKTGRTLCVLGSVKTFQRSLDSGALSIKLLMNNFQLETDEL